MKAVLFIGLASCLSLFGCGQKHAGDNESLALQWLTTGVWKLQAEYPVSALQTPEGVKFQPQAPSDLAVEVSSNKSIAFPGLENFTPMTLQSVGEDLGGGYAGNSMVYNVRLHVNKDSGIILIRKSAGQGGDLFALYTAARMRSE